MFDINYISLFVNFPPQLAVLIISMIPIAELRVGLPIAILIYHLPLWQSLFFAILGNIIPVFFILKFFEAVSSWLRKKFNIFDYFFIWLFDRTRNRFVKKYEKYGLWALAMFVSIPLPITGAWTGALAAWLFGIQHKKALFYIFVGVLIAALIVTSITTGILGFLNFLIQR